MKYFKLLASILVLIAPLTVVTAGEHGGRAAESRSDRSDSARISEREAAAERRRIREANEDAQNDDAVIYDAEGNVIDGVVESFEDGS